MLSNSDFRQLLDPKKGGQGLTTQFDIRTIAKWDNENRKKAKQQQQQQQKRSRYDDDPVADGSGVGASKKERLNEDGSQYRDRAEERRLNQTSDEFDAEMEAAASRLSAEQTKFLGGDESRTHLVKGLDFLLLQKMRSKETTASTNSSSSAARASHGTAGGADGASNSGAAISTRTEMGARLLQALSLQGLDIGGAHPGRFRIDNHYHYEFDMSKDFYQEIPIVVSRSKKEGVGGRHEEEEERVAAGTSEELLQRLKAYIHGGVSEAIEIASETVSYKHPSAPLHMQEGPAHKVVVDIYGDIFDDIGAYVPPDAASANSSKESYVRDDVAPVKVASLGLFSSPAAGDGDSDDGGDRMAEVKLLLRAQVLRDRASEAAMAAAADAADTSSLNPVSAAVAGEWSGKSGLVHRNVFGVDDEAGPKKRGDALAHGSYDMFGGDIDGSDDDYGDIDGGEEKGAKKLNWNKDKRASQSKKSLSGNK